LLSMQMASGESNKGWESSKKNQAITSFSLGVAYTWFCSFFASVLSIGTLKSTKGTSEDQKTSPPVPIGPVLLPSRKKTLILVLDETLVHSTIKPVNHHHLTVDVIIDGMNCRFYVIKRPHVDYFLKRVTESFDVIIFTASMKQYADPLIDQLDPKRVLKGRLFRESCLMKEGNFIKDLSLIGQDLASTIIVDNSPVAYSNNKENALPIDNWMGDNPSDDALLNLLPFLNALQYTTDVRSILSLRTS